MVRFLSLIAMLGVMVTGAYGQSAPQRVVSLNMCIDQLLLAFGDPDQIVGLSRYAANPVLSFAADQATDYPRVEAAAELVLALEPDLVLTGQFTNSATKHLLRQMGLRVVEIPFVRTLEEAQAVMLQVGDLLGRPNRAERLIDEIDTALAAHRSDVQLSALVIQRRGYATGTASLTGDLLAELGVALASDTLVSSGGGFADLEQIVAAEPDVLIVSTLAPRLEDQGIALLAHPALRDRFPIERRILLPERLTLCAGPSLLDAVDHIAGERDRALERLARE